MLTHNSRGGATTAEDVKRWSTNLDLDIVVLADPEGAWLAEWGAQNGSQHTYAIIGTDGLVSWRKDDGGSASVKQITIAANATE